MNRREFIFRLGTGAVVWPFAVLAQRSTIPFIGFLNSGSPNEREHLVKAFLQGLKEGGFVDGRDVAVEYRWAEGRPDRLPRLAAELVSRNVAVIAAGGDLTPALTAKSATSTIPIVFTSGQDPVKLGLVASLSRPGGNVTGVVNLAVSLQAKRLQILLELLPGAGIVYLVNPDTPDSNLSVKEILAAAEAIAAKIEVLSARNEPEIEAAFAGIKQRRANAVLVANNPFFLTRRDKIVELATRYAIPASYPFREFPEAGGLMSYGPNLADGYRQFGVYVARILKGAKPADLPVIQLTTFELVLNLKTAKALGLKIPQSIVLRADEVIE